MASSAASSSTSASTGVSEKYRLPCNETMVQLAKLAIIEDKPVMYDYWTDSLDHKVVIALRDGGEKLLVKSEDEYTSPISKVWQSKTEFIVMTENSLYVVSRDIGKKRIS